jgi:hypothetical protein
MSNRARLASLFAVVAVVFASEAGAQPGDHMRCFAIKDTQPKATYTAELDGLVAQPGCLIKVPAKLACVPTRKLNVTPPPPGNGPIQPMPTVLCYKTKCPNAPVAPQTLTDQFGTRPIFFRRTTLLCAPVAVTVTTTTGPTTTSFGGTIVTTTSCPTTTIAASCLGAFSPSCAEPCPSGMTCTTGGPGGHCQCVGPAPACGDVSQPFCSLGTCPPGTTCTSRYELPECAPLCVCE